MKWSIYHLFGSLFQLILAIIRLTVFVIQIIFEFTISLPVGKYVNECY